MNLSRNIFLPILSAILLTQIISCSSLNERSPSSLELTDGELLFKMSGLDVIVKKGDLSRAPLTRHYSLEMATERSQPEYDPSLQNGYHFELLKPIPQKDLALDLVWTKLSIKSEVTENEELLSSNSNSNSKAITYNEILKNHASLLDYFQLNSPRFSGGNLEINAGPAIVNSNYEYYGISDREYGFCWGFATMDRFFTQIAFFDKYATAPTYTLNGLKKNEKWFRFYQKKIDRILGGTADVIPGFANFREFTKIPEIEFYLKIKAMKLWAERAMSFDNLSTFFTSTKPMTNTDIQQLVTNLADRLRMNELPKILFTAKNSHKIFFNLGTADVHAVLVTGLNINPDLTGKIILWDINFYSEDISKSEKYIEIRKNSVTKNLELHYGPWFSKLKTDEETYESSMLGKVRLAPENDIENAKMLTSLKQFCDLSSNAQYCK